MFISVDEPVEEGIGFFIDRERYVNHR